jgi:membrane-associated phospholipid phosphatase
LTWHAFLVLIGNAALVASVAALVALAWLLPHHGFRLLRAPADKALHHPRLAAVWQRLPAARSFLERHLHDARTSWLRLLVGAAVAAGGLLWFAHLLHEVLTDRTVVTADLCLHNTVLRFQSPALHRFYSLTSELAGPLSILLLVGGLSTLVWAGGRRREALGLLGAFAGSQVLSFVLKRVVGRPRPLEAIAWLRDPSFPSGHTLTAAAVFGFLVYLILRDEPRHAHHWWLAAPLLLLIGAVPIGRIYLGVHWPYDTLASLALGLAWLAVLITLFKLPWIARRFAGPDPAPPWLGRSITVFGVLFVGYAAVLATRPPLPRLAWNPPPQRIALATLTGAFPPNLPRVSHDAVGGPMEPVSLLFVANRREIEAVFERAGWQEAETPSVHGLLRELWDVIRDRPDPRGPATPAYYADQPQDLTFEKAADPTPTIRRRHHTRLWQTPLWVFPAGLPLWAATASYDIGVKLVAEPYLVTHRIDLHVDQERDLIVRELQGAGAEALSVIPVTGAGSGHNAAGDHFVTDGRATVLLIRSRPSLASRPPAPPMVH